MGGIFSRRRGNTLHRRPAAAGDRVAAGDVLLVVEAMKMLNELRARVPGVVSAVHVAGRDLVEIGNPLVEVSEETAPG